jgi:hypothetical protein
MNVCTGKLLLALPKKGDHAPFLKHANLYSCKEGAVPAGAVDVVGVAAGAGVEIVLVLHVLDADEELDAMLQG